MGDHLQGVISRLYYMTIIKYMSKKYYITGQYVNI